MIYQGTPVSEYLVGGLQIIAGQGGIVAIGALHECQPQGERVQAGSVYRADRARPYLVRRGTRGPSPGATATSSGSGGPAATSAG